MEWSIVLFVVLGLIIGLIIGFTLKWILSKSSKDTARDLFTEIQGPLKEAFGNMTLDILTKSQNTFLQLGTKEFESKKKDVEEFQHRLSTDLEKVKTLVQILEKDRTQKFGELSTRLTVVGEDIFKLRNVTTSLKEALSSTKIRGQWGERMADDILKIIGFGEGINYVKQKEIAGIGGRPDFTFFLPNDAKLNMDVKFPFDNYLKYVEAKSDIERENYKKQFLKDVKNKIKEIMSREYINPEQKTLDFALLFIPNEQVFSFIQEEDRTIVDEALKNKVIMCSPLTLYAILSVIRQSLEIFSLEHTSDEILSILGMFNREWINFLKKMDELGKRIEDAQKKYGELTITRRKKLDKQLERIEELRIEKKLPVSRETEEAEEEAA